MKNNLPPLVLSQLIKQTRFDEITAERIRNALELAEITYPNLVGNHQAYLPFILLSAPRSGSTFVGSLLQSHPNLVCYNELYKSDRCHFNYPFFPEEDDANLIEFRDSMEERFLEQVVFRGYLDNFSAVGFKMLYPQLWDSRFGKVRKWLLHNPKIRFIHLIRRNTLQVLISLKRAQLSNEWWRMDPAFLSGIERAGLYKGQLNEKIEIPPFAIDTAEAQFFFEDSESQLHRMKNELSRHAVLDINYEELLQEPEQHKQQILTFLGVSNKPLTSRNIVQNTKSMRENVSNYDALKAYFTGSKWAVFFCE
jgi:LPS sulfotransferase NodH